MSGWGWIRARRFTPYDALRVALRVLLLTPLLRLRRVWATRLLALAACAAAAVCAVLHHDRVTTRSLADQAQLCRSLAESAAAYSKTASRVRVAVFQIQEGNHASVELLSELLESESRWRCEPISPADVQGGGLHPFDAVIFPGGSGSKQAAALGEQGRRAVREFVRAGGGYVGICAGAFLATARYEWSLALVNAKTLTGEREIAGVGMKRMAYRGAGKVKMELTDAGRAVFGDPEGAVEVAYSGGPILSPAGNADLPQYVTLALFRTEICKYEPQRGTMIDTPAIVAATFGRGRVVLFSPHPEMTRGLEPLVRRAILTVARESPKCPHER